MNITQRLALHKLGYTKEEINAFAAEEKAAAEPDAQPAAEPDAQPTAGQGSQASGFAEVLTALNNLTAAVQAQNIKNAEQPKTQPVKAEDVITGALKNL